MIYKRYATKKHFMDLIDWTKHCSSKYNYTFILERIAPILLKRKPSELLNVSIEQGTEWEEFKQMYCQGQMLQLKEIRLLNGRLQVFFYHEKLLDSLLSNPSIRTFLTSLNYPVHYSLETYLATLIRKISPQSFPHEIGVFLGYPLKDVLGFMGLTVLPYKKTEGWRIYGDESLSLEIYHQHQEARNLAQYLVQEIV